MTKIVGHRGAAGLALENTIASIKIAQQFDVDAIEFDVRLTKDNHLVLAHDQNLSRVGGPATMLSSIDISDLTSIHLKDDLSVPTLREALLACGDTPAIVELKDIGSAEVLATVASEFTNQKISATSFHVSEMRRLKRLAPQINIFVAEHINPIEILAIARTMDAYGITLNARLINPLTYWVAQHYNLKIMVYTVNNKFIGSFLRRLYPNIMICTDRPDLFYRKRRFEELAKKLHLK